MQIQVRIKRGSFIFWTGGGGGKDEVRKTIKSILQSKRYLDFIIASSVKTNYNSLSNL